MIPRAELQRLAALAGVRVELQERDYVLGCFLLALPLAELLCDAGALYRLLAAVWPAYLARQGLPVAVASEAPYLPLFDDRDIQAYTDTLFLQGMLPPARIAEAALAVCRHWDWI